MNKTTIQLVAAVVLTVVVTLLIVQLYNKYAFYPGLCGDKKSSFGVSTGTGEQCVTGPGGTYVCGSAGAGAGTSTSVGSQQVGGSASAGVGTQTSAGVSGQTGVGGGVTLGGNVTVENQTGVFGEVGATVGLKGVDASAGGQIGTQTSVGAGGQVGGNAGSVGISAGVGVGAGLSGDIGVTLPTFNPDEMTIGACVDVQFIVGIDLCVEGTLYPNALLDELLMTPEMQAGLEAVRGFLRSKEVDKAADALGDIAYDIEDALLDSAEQMEVVRGIAEDLGADALKTINQAGKTITKATKATEKFAKKTGKAIDKAARTASKKLKKAFKIKKPKKIKIRRR